MRKDIQKGKYGWYYTGYKEGCKFKLFETVAGAKLTKTDVITLCNGKQTVALLIIKSELYEEITAKVTDFGVFTLAKPTSSILVQNAVNWMLSCRERLRRIENKTLSIEEKMEEIRLVNRAKWLLIENLKMSEKDAHRYIEKQSMDRCVSRKIIVEEIIKTYK